MKVINSYEDLQELISDEKMLIVYFGSEGCGVCVSIKPKLEHLFSKYEKVQSIHIDIDKAQVIAGQHSVFVVPTILLFIEGKEILRESGIMSARAIDDKISRYYDMVFEN